MPASLLASSVGELVAKRPGLSRLFEKLGIDYCCGGKRSLEQACLSKGLDTATVTALLDDPDGGPDRTDVDVTTMSLTELANHVEKTHHAYLKREFPRLQPLIEKLGARHAGDNPKLAQLPYIFSAFRSDMEAHMAKEEQVLFPLVREIDAAVSDGRCPCGSIENPIRVMEIEHQHAGDALTLMRRVTDDFAVPADGCNTYRAVMSALTELETDMHQHVHKENNVLFPRAILMASNRSPDHRVV